MYSEAAPLKLPCSSYDIAILSPIGTRSTVKLGLLYWPSWGSLTFLPPSICFAVDEVESLSWFDCDQFFDRSSSTKGATATHKEGDLTITDDY